MTAPQSAPRTAWPPGLRPRSGVRPFEASIAFAAAASGFMWGLVVEGGLALAVVAAALLATALVLTAVDLAGTARPGRLPQRSPAGTPSDDGASRTSSARTILPSR